MLTQSLQTLLAAPFVGSFLGTVIRRLADGRPMVLARSACETCGATLSARDMLPLASFAWLHGRCRQCGAAIGWFHPAIEAAALAVALSAYSTGSGGWLSCTLGWWLLVLAGLDLKCWRLPDVMTLPLLLVGLAVTECLAPDALTNHAVAAALGYITLSLLGLAYQRWRGRPGLGEGDAKFLAAAGAWLGVSALPSVVVVAAACGIVAALARHGASAKADTVVHFGPCLALAIWLIWLCGSPFS